MTSGSGAPRSGRTMRVVAHVDDVEPAGSTWAKRLWMTLDDGKPLTARLVSIAPVCPGDTVIGFVVPYEEGLPDELAILVTEIVATRTS